MKRLTILVLAIGVMLTALAMAPPSSTASVFTRRSLKCLKSIRTSDKEAFAGCHPKLTIAAIQRLAMTSVTLFPPPNILLQADDPGDSVTFFAMTGCRHKILHGLDGCSVLTQETGDSNGSYSCTIGSNSLVEVELWPSGTFKGAQHPSEVWFDVKKPVRFQVVVTDIGPNPFAPPYQPC